MEISREEARKRLENSVKNIDLINHFLGNDSAQEDFLKIYRGYYAQLCVGDRLEIRASPSICNGKYHTKIPILSFNIILCKRTGKEKLVYGFDKMDSTGIGTLLYDE
ncbi:MAG: hypothetical protein ABIH65_03935 [Nanoarchaeota archaeon]